jgi:hypothetical protein
MAISRNLRNSRLPFLAEPSAMFAAAEYAARRAWEVRPYCSLDGQSEVSL